MNPPQKSPRSEMRCAAVRPSRLFPATVRLRIRDMLDFEIPTGTREEGFCTLLVDLVLGYPRWLIILWHEDQRRFCSKLFIGCAVIILELVAVWVACYSLYLLALTWMPWSAGTCELSAAQLTKVELYDGLSGYTSYRWRFDADVLVRTAAGGTWHAVAHRRELPSYDATPDVVCRWWTNQLGQELAVADADAEHGNWKFVLPDEPIACYFFPEAGSEHVRFMPSGNNSFSHVLQLFFQAVLCVGGGGGLLWFALQSRWPEQSECDRRVREAKAKRELS